MAGATGATFGGILGALSPATGRSRLSSAARFGALTGGATVAVTAISPYISRVLSPRITLEKNSSKARLVSEIARPKIRQQRH